MSTRQVVPMCIATKNQSLSVTRRLRPGVWPSEPPAPCTLKSGQSPPLHAKTAARHGQGYPWDSEAPGFRREEPKAPFPLCTWVSWVMGCAPIHPRNCSYAGNHTSTPESKRQETMQRPALILELACFGLRKRCPFLVALCSQRPEDQGLSSVR